MKNDFTRKKQEQDFESYLNSVEVRDFFEEMRRKVVPKIAESAIFLTMYEGDLDLPFALQLGVAILMSKPILVLGMKGAAIPLKLLEIADKVVEIDSMQAPGAKEKLEAAVLELIATKRL